LVSSEGSMVKTETTSLGAAWAPGKHSETALPSSSHVGRGVVSVCLAAAWRSINYIRVHRLARRG
jgi:hypothetical protein